MQKESHPRMCYLYVTKEETPLPRRKVWERRDAAMTDDVIDDDDSKFTRLTFLEGQFLTKEGEVGNSTYVILNGKVEIKIGSLSKNPKVLATRGVGDVIGEMALFDGKAHMASAVAVQKTTVNAMSREEFLRRIENMDPVMRGIMQLMVNRMREMADDLLQGDCDVNWANWRRD